MSKGGVLCVRDLGGCQEWRGHGNQTQELEQMEVALSVTF